MSSNDMKTTRLIAAKGHNEVNKVVNPIVHIRDANDAFDVHVPEIRGT
jgi:hypothetical protein